MDARSTFRKLLESLGRDPYGWARIVAPAAAALAIFVLYLIYRGVTNHA